MFPNLMHTHAHNLIACALMGWGFERRSRAIAFVENEATGQSAADGAASPPSSGTNGAQGVTQTPPANTNPPDNATIRAMRAELEKRAKDLTTFQTQLAELAKQNEDLRHQQEVAGKSVEERARIEADRVAKQHQASLKETQAALESARQSEVSARKELDTYQLTTRVQSAVSKAKGLLPGASDHARQLFMLEANAHMEPAVEDGKPKRAIATVDGVDFEDMDAAFTKWVAKYPHLQAHPGGGSGSPFPNSGGASLNLDSMGAEDLISAGLKASKRTR